MSSAELRAEAGTAYLSGELTFATVTRLYGQMESVSRSDGIPSSVDLADVSKIDSAGLALLLEWQSRFRKSHGGAGKETARIEITNPPEALLKIARLCDAEAYLSPPGSAKTE